MARLNPSSKHYRYIPPVEVPKIQRVQKKDEESAFTKAKSKIGWATVERVAVGVACGVFPHLTPVILGVYNVYKLGKFGERIYDVYNTEKRQEDKLKVATKEGVGIVASETLGYIIDSGSEGEINEFASDFSKATIKSGILDQVDVDKEVFQRILKGTVVGGIKGGMKGVVEFTVYEVSGDTK